MSDPDATNTALALAGAALQLQAETLFMLVETGVIPPSYALTAVQRARKKLEGDGQPGGVRASVYLESLEDGFRPATGG